MSNLKLCKRDTCKNRNKQESPPAWTQEAYRPPRSHSNFLLFRGGGGGGHQQIFFPPVWTCIKPNLMSKKIFPFTWGVGGSLDKIFSPSLNMYQAKSGVKNFSLYWGGGGVPRQNFFYPVWTCIKPNLVSKIFPFTGGGGVHVWLGSHVQGGIPQSCDLSHNAFLMLPVWCPSCKWALLLWVAPYIVLSPMEFWEMLDLPKVS